MLCLHSSGEAGLFFMMQARWAAADKYIRQGRFAVMCSLRGSYMSDRRIWRKRVGVFRSTAKKRRKLHWTLHAEYHISISCLPSHALQCFCFPGLLEITVDKLFRSCFFILFYLFFCFWCSEETRVCSNFPHRHKNPFVFFFRPQIFSPVLWAAAWMFKRLIIDEAKPQVRYQATQEMVEADTTAAASLQHRGFVLSLSPDVPVDDGRLKYLYPLHSRVHIWSRWRRTHWQGRTSRWVLKSECGWWGGKTIIK